VSAGVARAPSAGAAGAPEAVAVMGQARHENFPVANVILPRRVRGHLLALYGFARLVDDAGDEAQGNRLALLDELEADLERVWDGTPRHPLLARLQPTAASCQLPIDPFRGLIEANRRDQVVQRYETFTELREYCALSASTIGELVLRIFGFATAERITLSDKICIALQLTEHWQDVAEDYARGRIYLPAEDRRRFGVAEEELRHAPASTAFKAMMQFEVQRTRDLLREGAPLARELPWRYAVAVTAFAAGGWSALAAIERHSYDVLSSTARARRLRRALDLGAALIRGGLR
jgi:squalene synthase HpnC